MNLGIFCRKRCQMGYFKNEWSWRIWLHVLKALIEFGNNLITNEISYYTSNRNNYFHQNVIYLIEGNVLNIRRTTETLRPYFPLKWNRESTIHNIIHLSLGKKKGHTSLSNFLFIFSNYPAVLKKDTQHISHF